MLRNLLRKDRSDIKIDNNRPESEKSYKTGLANKGADNLLVAPKELSKLFGSKDRNITQKGQKEGSIVKDMEYYHRNLSDGSVTSEDDTGSNEEILIPNLRTRRKTFKERDYDKIKTFRNGPKDSLEVEERRINVGVRQTNISRHPTILEHKIKVVKDQRLKMSIPSLEGPPKNFESLCYENNREGGDTLKGDLADFLTYPVNLENIKIPKKRELYQLMHRRICSHVNPDIIVVIESSEFFCHRMVLQCYSKFFDEINNLTEEKVITIEEKGVTKQAFAAIYSWMLSLNESGLKYITRENFLEVMLAAQFLQIRDLEEQCLALMDSTEVFSEGHAYQLFKQANQFNQPSIKELMVPRIQHFFLPFVSTQDFIDLPIEDLCTFLSSSYIVVHSEMEVFMSAARWLLENWNERKKYLPKVMNCIRFGLMNPLELVDIRKNPESPEFLKITEDLTIQKYIDDGLAYSTYCTMKGGSDDLKYRCQLFGLEIPQPRNWTDTPKYYKSYNEFLCYLKQIKMNPLKVIDDNSACAMVPTAQNYPLNTEEAPFEIDFSSPLSTFTDGIPSMSNLLSVGLKNKVKKLRKRESKSNYKIKDFNGSLLREEDKSQIYLNIPHTKKAQETLKSKAATIIQAAYRGYRVRKIIKLENKLNSQKNPVIKKDGRASKSKFCISTSGNIPHRQRMVHRSSSDFNLGQSHKAAQVPQTLYYPNGPTILILGGLNPQQRLSLNNDGKPILRYSLEMNKWERVSSLPKGRYYHSVSFLRGRIYILGGVDPKNEEMRTSCICSDVWSFNPYNCEWTKETNLRIPRKNFGLVSFQGYLYAIGGQGPNDALLSSVERYDSEKKVWEEICPLPEPRLSPAVTKFGGTIWVVGGMGSNSKHAMSSNVYSYDLRQNKWITRSPLRVGKALSVLINHEENLYLVGGAEKDIQRGCSVSSNSIDVYDPKNNKWQTYTRMHIPRHSHTSEIIENNLFIIGGTTTQEMKSLNNVEIWNFENRCWSSNPIPLPMVLTGHASVTIPPASQVIT